MRLAVVAVCLLALAACTSPGDGALSPAPTGPVAGVPDSLATRLVPNALTEAFARLDASHYDARVSVEALDESGIRLGRFERTIRHTPGAPDRVLTTRASGTLTDTTDLAIARLADPMPSVLADTPAYLAPSTRDQYTARAGSASGTVRAVDIRHTADTDQAVERVLAAIDTLSGAVLRFAIFRTSASAIYDEATRAEVRLRPTAAGPIPQAVETTSTVSIPLSGTTTYRVAWQITPTDQRAANTRNP